MKGVSDRAILCKARLVEHAITGDKIPLGADLCYKMPKSIDPHSANVGPRWVHGPPLRVKTRAATVRELSTGPPTRAVLSSPDSATEAPCLAFPTPPAPTKLVPCWDAALFLLGQTPPLRVKIHAARVFKSSQSPLTIAVLPSPDSAIEAPCRAFPAVKA
jgi:hypothetical protein